MLGLRRYSAAWPRLWGLALALLVISPGHAEEKAAVTHPAGRSALIDEASPCATARKNWYSLHCTLMENPLGILPSIEALESELRRRTQSPSELMDFAARLRLGEMVQTDSSRVANSPQDHRSAQAADLLALGLRSLLADPVSDTVILMDRHLPNRTLLQEDAQAELGRVLLALSQAEDYRKQAFEKLPASIHAKRWIEGIAAKDAGHFDRLDLMAFLPDTDDAALAAGMQVLVAAVERFRTFALTHREWPALTWEIETPLGPVVIDLSETRNERTMSRPLLLIDRGGNDSYRFVESVSRPPISVLIDLSGDDEYLSDAPAACPSSAVMGYGILWDESGNDRYEGTRLAQSAAVMGSALLYDGSGEDSFVADLQSQAYALFGTALLINGGLEADRYLALSQAQGAAGPAGTALLIEGGGNDHYILSNDRVVVPSAQLPDRNASLGQGSAFSIRSKSANPGLLGGGVGILLDLSGDDIYRAQVFAQGSGYFHGTGILLDGAGQDDYETAWYGMGAAAHGAIGVLVDRGNADDRYAASHSTSLSAAHDRSLTLFLDTAGDDSYELGGLGFGAAHEESVALFFDLAGTDRYRLQESFCRAFGVSLPQTPQSPEANSLYPGIFIDAGGDDQFPGHCAAATRDRPLFD